MRPAGGASRAGGRLAHLVPLRTLSFLAVLLSGCAHFPLNEPLTRLAPESGYRFAAAPVAEPDDLVVLMSISGGGSRAAAFAYGVMEELRRTALGAGVDLLDEVDVITAVSGGAIVASYYGLYGDGLFDDFLPRFLERDVQGALARRLLAPGNWVRLASRNFDRVDLMAELFDREVFGGATFADLEGRRPFVLVNATDMTRGVPFEFTQDRFDPMCADLSTFPLGRAVAASAAVPLLATPVTLESFGWDACGYEAESGAQPAASFRDPARRRWVHLQDGGLAGNFGLPTLVDVVLRPGAGCGGGGLDPAGRRVVVIVVDAVADLDRSAERKKQGPSLAKTLLAAVNIPLDRSSDSNLEGLGPELDRWLERSDACAGVTSDAENRRRRVYPIFLDFAGVAAYDRVASDRLRRMPARFRLSLEDLAALRDSGARSLRQSAELQRLLADVASGSR